RDVRRDSGGGHAPAIQRIHSPRRDAGLARHADASEHARGEGDRALFRRPTAEGRLLKALLSFDELRAREFARLGDHAYLDYTGSALYAGSQLRAHHALLESRLFGNPHSDSAPSRASSAVIENARRR